MSERWKERYEELIRFKQEHGHCEVPFTHGSNSQFANWVSPEVTELREEKWERALAALLRKARKTNKDALAAPKSAKWKDTDSADYDRHQRR